MRTETTAGPDLSTRPRRMIALGTLSLAMLLIAIDASILNVALPRIADDLRPDATQLLWIVDSYSLTVAALLVTTAALGDRFGRRRMLRLGLIVFAAAAMLAALSTSAELLISARVMLGVGAALAMPATLSLLRAVFTDDRERAFAIGLWSAVGAAGFVLGPVVGGVVLQLASWPFVFWVQLPFIALALLATLRLPEAGAAGVVSVDVLGVLLSGAGLVALVWGIKELGESGLAGSGISLMLIGVMSIAALVVVQLRRARPMIDVRLFRSVRFSAASVAVLASNVALAAPLLLLTQQLQIAQGLDPLPAGLAFLPVAVGAVISGPFAPRVVRMLGMNGAVGGGFLLVSTGLLVFSFVTVQTPYLLLVAGMVLLGAGVSVASAAASAALLAAAPAERAGNAAAIQETGYELGLTVGVSVFGSFALSVFRANLDLPAGLDPALVSAVESGLPQAASVLADQPGLLAIAIDAFSASFADTMLLAAVAALVIAVIAVIALPRDRESSSVTEH